ncbi:MAG TPA: PH domain-containing protein [Thermomicrobiales bacterium]|nr:PH domain-containing protein [Thermomicrobiales bacterium]
MTGIEQTGDERVVLPVARPAPSERLDPRALTAWRISGLLSSLLLLALAAAVSWLLWYLEQRLWLVALPLLVALVAGVIATWVAPAVQWRRWRYAVTERDIELQRGLIVVTRTLIPIVRVQHVDTRQGPILRRFDLAGIAIATAAGTEEIPALAVEVADDLRHRISDLAGLADDV